MAWFLGAICVIAGGAVVAASILADDARMEAPRWVVSAAGAAFLPFPIIMFVLSRWSGGLVGRTGPRIPLTAGPLIAAAGFALFARVEVGP